MPRYSVEHNGKWACFSTISDQFIRPFSDKADHEAWRLLEYGRADYLPAEKCNMMTIGEAVSDASLYNEKEDVINNLVEAGIDRAEAETLWETYRETELYEDDEDMEETP